MSGLEALKRFKEQGGGGEVILVTGQGSLEVAIKAIKLGAFHYLTKPVKLTEMRGLVKSACEAVAVRRENRALRQALRAESGLESMIGASGGMRQVFELVRKVAPVGCNVLIQGASGTGKALVAKALHRLSPRRDRAMVSFNCGGFTEELIGSELFGHEKGAFTGASATKIGLLEAGERGARCSWTRSERCPCPCR